MTPRKKIFINVMATYGRSLYALVLGLFTARWALNALGQVDYGLFGLVGGLSGLVTLVNGLLSFAVSRFYGVSVGIGLSSGREMEGLEECRKWFNAAVVIHTIVPVALVLIGYPIGEWAVRHFLAIPGNRVEDCLWVWRFTCISCFVGMVSVPFTAMYGAKQDIAELTIYSFASSTLNALFLFYMVMHPRVWLFHYALWGCILSVLPTLIQVVRSHIKYPECRYNREYLWCVGRFKDLIKFAGARFWTMLSKMLTGQGNAILVNKFMGPAFNASMSVGTAVVSHASTLSSALTGAFWPAIMNAAGSGDKERVIGMSFQLCRLGTVLVLLFALPLLIELPCVLQLWLKAPPPYVTEICVAVFIDCILERMSEGLYMPIMAFGDGVVRYSWYVGWGGFTKFLIACILFVAGLGMNSICIGLVVCRFVVIVIRLRLAGRFGGMSAYKWVRNVFIPLIMLCVITLIMGFVPRIMLETSWWRLVLVVCACEIVFLPVTWFIVLNVTEREFISSKLRLIFARIK